MEREIPEKDGGNIDDIHIIMCHISKGWAGGAVSITNVGCV